MEDDLLTEQEKKIRDLEKENAELRKQVIKGRDVAKHLADRYAEKLAAFEEEHKKQLEQVRVSAAQSSDTSGRSGGISVEDIVSRVSLLESAVEEFVDLSTSREKALNEQVKLLSRALRRRDRYIAQIENDDEKTDERLLRLEGRVRGVLREARLWNSKERDLLSRIKEESLVVVHLTQREQMMMNEQKDLTLRLERAERSAKEYEKELEEWITRARGPKKEEQSDTLLKASVGSLPALPIGANELQVPSPVSEMKRKGRSHHRSESLGVAMLPKGIDSNKADAVVRESLRATMSGSGPMSLSSKSSVEAPSRSSTVSPSVTTASASTKVSFPGHGSVRVRSGSKEHVDSPPPTIVQAAAAPATIATTTSSASSARVDPPPPAVVPSKEVTSPISSKSGSRRSSRVVDPSEIALEPANHVDHLRVSSKNEESTAGRSRKSKKSSQDLGVAAVDAAFANRRKSVRMTGDNADPLDGVSAQTLAEVEAEISALLHSKK